MTLYIDPTNSDYWESNPNRKTLPDGAIIGKNPTVNYNADGSRTTATPEANDYDIFKPLSAEDYAKQVTDRKSQTAKRIQDSIDGIHNSYTPIYAQEKLNSQGRLGSTATINALSGQRGAPTGAANTENTTQYNNQQVQAITARRNAEISSIRQRYEDQEREDIKYMESLRRSDTDKYLEYSQKDKERKLERTSNKISDMIASGIGMEAWDEADIQGYMDIFGYTDPEDAKKAIDYKIGQKLAEKEVAKLEADRKGRLDEADIAYKEAQTGQFDFENFMSVKNYDQKAGQLEFENLMTAKNYNQKEREISNSLQQMAFENKVSLENLKLDKDKFSSDMEYKYASLSLDKLKTDMELLRMENVEAPEIKKIDGVDYEFKNGEWVKPATPQSTPQDRLDKSNKVISAVEAVQELDWGSVVGMIQGKLPDLALTGKQAAINEKIKTLKSLLTLDNMGIMKGVLSDADIKIITSASTSLNRAMDNKSFDKELKLIKHTAKSIMNSDKLQVGQIMDNQDGSYSYKNLDGTTHTGDYGDKYVDKTAPNDDLSFSKVDGDTNTAILQKVAEKKDDTKGGQCGAFVNRLTGLGLGDSYESKMSKMDPSIKKPEPGMVFTMPYEKYGHVGFIVGIDGDHAIVKDSNYKLDEKVKTHKIAINKMTGFARV